jgi:hypothetical protein
MKKITLLTLLVLAVSFTGLYAASKEFKGYLSDVHCADLGKSEMGGYDLTMNPEKHTLECMKAEPCMASGYGIFIKGKDGKYVFHKFDKAGSDMAAKNIVEKSKKIDNIKIKVKGTLMKDGTITVMSIKEEGTMKPAKGAM